MEGLAISRRVPGRRCGTCTLCCKVLEIPALHKPKDVLCANCRLGRGCNIYLDRPGACRQFYCEFLTNPALNEAWRPSLSKLVLISNTAVTRIGAHVDPDRPAAWRREPFYSRLKEWAVRVVPDHGPVFVCIGKRTIVILPDRDVDLGMVEANELIVNEYKRTPAGIRWNAMKIKKDDPRAKFLEVEVGRPVVDEPR